MGALIKKNRRLCWPGASSMTAAPDDPEPIAVSPGGDDQLCVAARVRRHGPRAGRDNFCFREAHAGELYYQC